MSVGNGPLWQQRERKLKAIGSPRMAALQQGKRRAFISRLTLLMAEIPK